MAAAIARSMTTESLSIKKMPPTVDQKNLDDKIWALRPVQ